MTYLKQEPLPKITCVNRAYFASWNLKKIYQQRKDLDFVKGGKRFSLPLHLLDSPKYPILYTNGAHNTRLYFSYSRNSTLASRKLQ